MLIVRNDENNECRRTIEYRQRKLVYKRIYVTGHRASICCPYRKRIGEEIGTRLTFERSRDVTRECSRVSYRLFYCTGGTSTWSRHLVQTHTQLTYPFVPEVHMFRGRSASKPMEEQPTQFSLSIHFRTKLCPRKKRKETFAFDFYAQLKSQSSYYRIYAPFSNYTIQSPSFRFSLMARFNYFVSANSYS